MELRRYLAILRSRWVLIALSVVVAAAGGYAATDQQVSYQADATIYVGLRRLATTSEEVQDTNEALITIERSIFTFAVMIDSAPTAADAIGRTQLQRSPGSVVGATTAAPIPGTQLIQVRVADADPGTAQLLANAMAEVFVENVQRFEPTSSSGEEGEFPALPAYVFESAALPVVPDPVPLVDNTVVAALFGMVVAVSAVLLVEYLDITLKSSAEAERALELPVLAAIPRGATMPAMPVRPPPVHGVAATP